MPCGHQSLYRHGPTVACPWAQHALAHVFTRTGHGADRAACSRVAWSQLKYPSKPSVNQLHAVHSVNTNSHLAPMTFVVWVLICLRSILTSSSCLRPVWQAGYSFIQYLKAFRFEEARCGISSLENSKFNKLFASIAWRVSSCQLCILILSASATANRVENQTFFGGNEAIFTQNTRKMTERADRSIK